MFHGIFHGESMWIILFFRYSNGDVDLNGIFHMVYIIDIAQNGVIKYGNPEVAMDQWSG